MPNSSKRSGRAASKASAPKAAPAARPIIKVTRALKEQPSLRESAIRNPNSRYSKTTRAIKAAEEASGKIDPFAATRKDRIELKKRYGHMPSNADALIRRLKVCEELRSLIRRHLAIACVGLIRIEGHPVSLSHLFEVVVEPRGDIDHKDEFISIFVNRRTQYINPEQERMEKAREGTWDTQMGTLSARTHFDQIPGGGGYVPWWEHPTMENTENLAIDLIKKIHGRQIQYIESLQFQVNEFNKMKETLKTLGGYLGLRGFAAPRPLIPLMEAMAKG